MSRFRKPLILFFILCVMVAAMPLAACDTDDGGSGPAEGIVSLAPANTEILFALGLGNSVVGVTDACDYPPQARQIPTIGGYETVDVDSVIDLEPDLVLAAGIHEENVVPQLQEAGIRVLVIDPQTVTDVLASIALVATMTQTQEESFNLVTGLENRIDQIEQQVAATDNRPGVFCITWHDPLLTAGGGTLLDDLIEIAGGRNIFADARGMAEVDLQTAASRNPDVILALTNHGAAEDAPLTLALESGTLSTVTARQRGTIYGMDADLVARPGPRIVDGLEQIAGRLQSGTTANTTGSSGDNYPQRIVSLAPSNTEVLFALGLADRIVGVTEYCNYPPEARDTAQIGGFSTVDMEKVIALAPDLIVAASIHQGDLVPELERRGFNVFTYAPDTVADVLTGIEEIGTITGTSQTANQLIVEMRTTMNSIIDTVSTIPPEEKPRVFYLTWHDPIWTLGKGTITHELIEMAGGRNIMSDTTDHSQVDLESLIIRNPEVILAASGHGSAENAPVQWARTEDRLANIDARINDRIYQIDSDLVTRPGPRLIEGLKLIASIIHPDLFD